MLDSDTITEKKDEVKFPQMRLYVRYMVSLRCKLIVKEELKKLEIKHTILPHGAILFHTHLDKDKINTLKKNLQKSGLDLLDVQESNLVEKIINTIVEVIHYNEELPRVRYTEIFDQRLVLTRDPILKIFSEVVGMSVIQFIILQKIERIKELILYENMPLDKISYLLNYKNEHLMTAQFKKYTGLSPSYFRTLKEEREKLASQLLE